MPSNYTRYIDFLTYKAAQAGIPLSGTFELTARCNLDCKMCYIHKKANDSLVKKSEMSAAEWIDIARTAQKAGMFLLLVTGGEPVSASGFLRDVRRIQVPRAVRFNKHQRHAHHGGSCSSPCGKFSGEGEPDTVRRVRGDIFAAFGG